jgi:hypothetical protein
VWYLLQGSIIFVVCAANIHWELTPNHYVPAIIGGGLAWCVSQAILDWKDRGW